mmetsp:Transcript_48823/g.115980  ORF Transcript_48823/g.115980 Transcript_48823/m.115980 type:complete len:206 (-) Transcript_48823:1053-1670(-)
MANWIVAHCTLSVLRRLSPVGSSSTSSTLALMYSKNSSPSPTFAVENSWELPRESCISLFAVPINPEACGTSFAMPTKVSIVNPLPPSSETLPELDCRSQRSQRILLCAVFPSIVTASVVWFSKVPASTSPGLPKPCSIEELGGTQKLSPHTCANCAVVWTRSLKSPPARYLSTISVRQQVVGGKDPVLRHGKLLSMKVPASSEV